MDLLGRKKVFPVTRSCPAYALQSERWAVCRETIEGEDIVKMRGEKYLPMASGRDRDARRKRYEAFKMRTPYVNFVGGAHGIMHAMIFRRSPTVMCSDLLRASGLLDDVDGKGKSLYQFTSDSVADLLKTGFGAWLLDVPRAENGLTQYDAERRGIRPYLTYYPAEQVINWIYDNSGGVRRLKCVVLHELVDMYTDGFILENKERWRVLAINDEGFYEQSIWTPVYEDRGGEKVVVDMAVDTVPVTVNGQRLTYIPLVLLPYEAPEKPPLFDLAMLNVHHYQLTADYTNGVHMTTVPTGYITGYTPRDDGEDEDITLGGDAFLTEENSEARFGVLSFSGEGLEHCEKAIDKIESQIAGIFMKNIAPDKKTSETAESAYVHRSGENARLATFARNVSGKLSQLMSWYAQWRGFDEQVEVYLNFDYETMSLDPNIINSIANISGQGKFPLYCVFYILQQQELINPDMSYDDFIFLIDQENLSGNTAEEIYESFKKRLAERSRTLRA